MGQFTTFGDIELLSAVNKRSCSVSSNDVFIMYYIMILVCEINSINVHFLINYSLLKVMI